MTPEVLAELRRYRIPAPVIQSLEAVVAAVEQLRARADAQEVTIASQAGHIDTLKRTIDTQAELIELLKARSLPLAPRTRRGPFLSGGLGKRR